MKSTGSTGSGISKLYICSYNNSLKKGTKFDIKAASSSVILNERALTKLNSNFRKAQNLKFFTEPSVGEREPPSSGFFK